MGKQNYLKVFLGLLLVFGVWLFYLNKDELETGDPVTTFITTIKENPQMLDVFIDQLLADDQLKGKFLHHPWIVESLQGDSLFVMQEQGSIQSDNY